MSDFDELIHVSAAIEQAELDKETPKKKSPKDYFALAVATFGVGYLPLAPGTWGSMVGVAIYLLFAWLETSATTKFSGWSEAQISAWIYAFNAVILTAFCLLGIWGAGHSTKLFKQKDPSEAVVDEVMGQLITCLFIPFTFSWQLILAGFLLFRLFDIWKPYPIDALQNLPAGLGVCADDILAGVYAGGCLAIIYAISLSL
jgi:phosphatidylglycerophosphatase A